jgi:parallel beta-helix repeat protein
MPTKEFKLSKRTNVKAVLISFGLLISVAACNLPGGVRPAGESNSSQAGQTDSQGNTGPVVPVRILPTPIPSPGQDYYVDPNGSDGNDGSQAAPWETIQHAVDSVVPGDTIFLESGTYDGARIEQSGTEDAWITLQAAPGASVMVNAPGPNNKHESNLEFETWEGDETVSFWLLDGLEVANAPFWGIDMRGGEGNHSHNFIIRNNLVHDNGLDSGKSGIFTAFVDDVFIEDNQSYSNGEHGIYLGNSGDRFIVRGNLLHNNNNCGLHINGDLEEGEDGIISDGLVENNVIYENGNGGCAGINFDGVENAIVLNNLFYENHAGGIAIFQEVGAICSRNIQVLNNTIVQADDGRWAINISGEDCVNNKIFNNIILTFHEWRGSIVIPEAGISGFESDYNVIMDRFSADDDDSVISLSEWQGLGYDANSVIASPGDIFTRADDYHLFAESAAVDKGITLQGVTVDMEGIPRPQGAGYDIGAFETAGGQTQSPSKITATQSTDTGGTITYLLDGRVYRIAAQEGATPEDISQGLDQLSAGSYDGMLNISPDGSWLVLETNRFDPECVDWACLAVISADLSSGEAVRANGQLIHNEGFSAIASGGDLVVYVAGDGPHERDLWVINRTDSAWQVPVLLTADSPHNFNHQPALSDDGSKVLFNCGPESYAGEGAEICEVSTSGAGFRVVLTPADSPTGFPTTGALHHPDYAPDGSIVFEADWDGEQIWRLSAGATEPIQVTDTFNNDNSPCVLPDGRIVSLWLDRPAGDGLHEIKVMASDGSSFSMLLQEDVLDAGIGCSS